MTPSWTIRSLRMEGFNFDSGAFYVEQGLMINKRQKRQYFANGNF